MYKKILILVVSIILILSFSEGVIAGEALSVKIELKDGSVIVGNIQKPSTIWVETKQGKLEVELKDIISIRFLAETSLSGQIDSAKLSGFRLSQLGYLIVTVTGNRTEGYEKFVEEMRKVMPDVCRWGSESLLYFDLTKGDMEEIKNTHTIFLLRPDDINQLKDLKAKYPNLVSCSYDKLKIHSKFNFCLLYFFYDAQEDKIRGFIIAERVDVSLAKLLIEKELPLDSLLRYEDGQLKEIEEK